MADLITQIHISTTMEVDLNFATAALLLQVEIHEAQQALASLDPENNDQRKALLEWMAQLRARATTVDRQIAAEISLQTEQAKLVYHRDHQMALELSAESEDSQAAILLDIQETRVNAPQVQPAPRTQPFSRAQPTQQAALPQPAPQPAPQAPQAAPMTLTNLLANSQPLVSGVAKSCVAPAFQSTKAEPEPNFSHKRPVPDLTTGDQEKRLRTASTAPNVQHECESCLEKFNEVEMLVGSCSHHYCRDCLVHLLENALVVETLFPPRCCRQPLPLEQARALISSEIWTRYEEKKIEHNDQSRTYCANPTCSKYILPSQVRGRVARCKSCDHQTCTRCKTVAHAGRCPEEDEVILTLAREEGWTRCSNCGHLVELRSGCNHIT
jgi:hypothetical protein